MCIPVVYADPGKQAAFAASVQAHMQGEPCTDPNCMSCNRGQNDPGNKDPHPWTGGCHCLKDCPHQPMRPE